MNTHITLCIDGPTVGDYNRKGCASLDDAFVAYANLNQPQLAHTHIEVQHCDLVYVIDPSTGVYRAPGDTPC